MKIPTPAELDPHLAELESKRTTLHAEKTVKVAEATALRARIAESPSVGNVAENRVRAILDQPLLPDVSADIPRLEALLTELNTINSALGRLDSLIQTEEAKASRLVCGEVWPEVSKRADAFAKAMIDLHTAHIEYDKYLDQVESTGANISSLKRVFFSYLGSPLARSAGYHYCFAEFVDSGILDRSDVPAEVR
jgi:hypothetical protein